MGMLMLGGKASSTQKAGGMLSSKVSQNLICIFVFWIFYMLTDNFNYYWDWALAKEKHIKSKGAIDRLYISFFTQFGSPPGEIAPNTPLVKFLFILQLFASIWINLGSGMGGALTAATGAIASAGQTVEQATEEV